MLSSPQSRRIWAWKTRMVVSMRRAEHERTVTKHTAVTCEAREINQARVPARQQEVFSKMQHVG